ncbi:leucine-rich repeat flightless-interacting protein 2-like, partial [Clarias magur]
MERGSYSTAFLQQKEITNRALPKLKELARDPLADTETGYQQMMENNTRLESTDYDPMSNVTTLREQLSVAQTRCEELKREKEREQEAHRILEAQCKEMEEALQKRDELLKEKEQDEEAHHVLASLFQEMRENFQRFEHVVEVILAQTEENYKEVMECCAQENKERSELMSKMNQLDNSVQEMSNKLLDVHNKHIKTTRDMMKNMLNEKILNQEKASLRASLAELGREYQGLLGSNAGLVADKNDLRAEVHRLQALLQDKEKELSESTERCDEMMR